MPDIDKISAIEISKNNFLVKYIDEKSILEISNYFLEAKRRRLLTVNEIPTIDEYYTINIFTKESDMIYTSFIYKENSKCYIEQPYWGVYRGDEEILALIEES